MALHVMKVVHISYESLCQLRTSTNKLALPLAY